MGEVLNYGVENETSKSAFARHFLNFLSLSWFIIFSHATSLDFRVTPHNAFVIHKRPISCHTAIGIGEDFRGAHAVGIIYLLLGKQQQKVGLISESK